MVDLRFRASITLTRAAQRGPRGAMVANNDMGRPRGPMRFPSALDTGSPRLGGGGEHEGSNAESSARILRQFYFPAP